ncbi:MAG TPA: hypothetical protein PLD20_04865 [Blastocatellia bacterium]|nr:hypothetical protein [Blastocatellia bacterium]HMV83567.1 hypothetical protein [Blastocatellia bacterium]HMX30472.1 hypothetical protein [Blastocatellia bacterium]HMY74862.1 hypothetical protein [Blastocatellia bacterium]HMZ17240.1 hypothetical protein [Blastocatellia bacterium]
METQNSLPSKFAVCLDNSGNEASLDVGKLYQVIPDEEAIRHGYLRVIDESGEDYWHAAEMFYLVELPNDLAVTLRGIYQTA